MKFDLGVQVSSDLFILFQVNLICVKGPLDAMKVFKLVDNRSRSARLPLTICTLQN